MCGIAGIVGRIGSENRAALRRMSEALSHRGPDADGFWEPGEGGHGPMLAHRRLSILDLSPSGAQPMVDAVTGDVVVLNGEIYNYQEIRAGLAASGPALQSSGDTAAMLRLLSVRGLDALPTLRGMFAFAYWDASDRTLALARDALGIKPLYICRNPHADGEWTIAFASEVRSLLASGLLPDPRLNPAAAASMVWNGFMVAPDTAVLGIESLMPGELRVFDSHGNERSRQYFWNLGRTARKPRSLTESELSAELETCVRLHLASDVPLGIFLSGGVDSSAVANLAQRSSSQPVHTFTLAFEEEELNEGVFARRIAEAIGTQHREVLLSEQYFVDRLDAALDSLDQPSFDGLNSYFMSQAVREAGFKVALVGSGGDELFGGYTSFRDLPLLYQWSTRLKWIPGGLKQAAARAIARWKRPANSAFAPQTRWAKLPAMVERGEDLIALYQLAYSLFLPEYQRELLGESSGNSLTHGLPAVMHERLTEETEQRSALSAVSVLEHRLFLAERLLRDTDAASMAASIEIRLPLVDQILWKNVDALADADRFAPIRSKAMLRRIGLRGLDPALFDRPKSGFELPYERWLRNALGSRIDDTLMDARQVRASGLDADAVARLWKAFQRSGAGLYWTRIWAIYSWIRWCDKHRLSM